MDKSKLWGCAFTLYTPSSCTLEQSVIHRFLLEFQQHCKLYLLKHAWDWASGYLFCSNLRPHHRINRCAAKVAIFSHCSVIFRLLPWHCLHLKWIMRCPVWEEASLVDASSCLEVMSNILQKCFKGEDVKCITLVLSISKQWKSTASQKAFASAVRTTLDKEYSVFINAFSEDKYWLKCSDWNVELFGLNWLFQAIVTFPINRMQPIKLLWKAWIRETLKL